MPCWLKRWNAYPTYYWCAIMPLKRPPEVMQ